MKIQLKLILFAVAIAFSSTVFAQKTDTLRLDESEVKHSPTKATIMSLALPGLGQAYNKKYWNNIWAKPCCNYISDFFDFRSNKCSIE